MTRLFISHSSQDDPFVRELRQTLADHSVDAWIDSRELLAGGLLDPDIKKAIHDSSAIAVVVSPDGLQSKWVGKELRYALEIQKQRGRDKFPVIPLSLDATKLGILEEFFNDEPLYILVSSAAGGIEEAIHPILVALGKKLPADLSETVQPKAEPLEELVLELTDLKFQEIDGVRRPTARARLVHESTTPGRPEVASKEYWRLVAPEIDTGELRWYLEKFAIWPSEFFRVRADKVVQSLEQWGKELYEKAMPVAHTANVMNSWAGIDRHAGRRFSVYVNAALERGASAKEVENAREAATLLLGLPWELLHNDDSYLFQGGKPMRVRRRLPNSKALDVPVMDTPIRILLISARPEDDSCGYIDHRASALPLVKAMEDLGGIVSIHVLNPPTLPALRIELDRAHKARQPYHVVHFDGHGVYNRHKGRGGLCFEHPGDGGKLEQRRNDTVYTDELGPLLNDHRIPLVFLEACQSAQAEGTSESVASELLKKGVASVVAMSHSVLVETARRFVGAFYGALAKGERVGDAMLAGQGELKDNTVRGHMFGIGEFRLEDWFVPVLFQEQADPQLFRAIPSRQTREDIKTGLAARLGELPPEPETGFVGRSRELLALQRLLHNGRYAVLRGQGGEGKTALAAEFARWMVRSQQIRRAAFVSVEGFEMNIVETLLDKLGHQLVKPKFSTQVDCDGDLDKAEMKIVRAIVEQPTLLVVDNMESILPPYVVATEALSEEARCELDAILDLCRRLNGKGETRLVFTSREELPAPFNGVRQLRELYQLDRDDAVKLVERVLNLDGKGAGAATDAAREEMEQLVDAVNCHARTLALLAPSLRKSGVEATRLSLEKLMVEMERKFPGNREKSLFASVELSLRRMSPENRERVKALAVFHGVVQLGILQLMMKWEDVDLISLVYELIVTGLATSNRYHYLTLNPALSHNLRACMNTLEREAMVVRWIEAMCKYVEYLYNQQQKNPEVTATLTVLELPNLFALLDQVKASRDGETTIKLACLLHGLLQLLGKPQLLKRVAQVRDAVEVALGGVWSNILFQLQNSRIEEQLATGRLREAFEAAQQLLHRAQEAGIQAYQDADFDLAAAYRLLARVLKKLGGAEQAVLYLDEARKRFEAIVTEHIRSDAERMATSCLAEQGDCLLLLGRLNESAAAYEESVRRSEISGYMRGVALGKGQLGSVYLFQKRYKEALDAYEEALERFTALNDPNSVSVFWHQTGMVYKQVGNHEAAEDAYCKSLAISVSLGNVAGQAGTLMQLGSLYYDYLGRFEEAANFNRQAADKYFEICALSSEGNARDNLAESLHKLHCLDQARQEIRRAIQCKKQFGHAAEPWRSWSILADIETGAGNYSAASEAKGKAVAYFLAYRRDGGENYYSDGHICLAVTQALLAGKPDAAATLLRHQAADPEATSLHTFIQTLQVIASGSRDCTLADAPDLNYTMAAEILLLIEALENQDRV